MATAPQNALISERLQDIVNEKSKFQEFQSMEQGIHQISLLERNLREMISTTQKRQSQKHELEMKLKELEKEAEQVNFECFNF